MRTSLPKAGPSEALPLEGSNPKRKTKAHAKTQRRKDYAKKNKSVISPNLFLQTQDDSAKIVHQNWNIEVQE